MDAQNFNMSGLVFNILGVILLFKFGPPQPSFDQGIGLGLEDANVLEDGKTVAEYNEEIRKKRKLYIIMSRSALGLILIGFIFQLLATIIP